MDVRKIKELCEVALPLIEKVEYSKPTPKSLLAALLEKTIEQIDAGYTSNDIMFTTKELVELVKTGSISEQKAKKFKFDHYDETSKLLKKVNKLKLQQGAADSKYVLELADTGETGGARNKKHHYLKLVEIEKEAVQNQTQTYYTEIKYDAVQLPKPKWYVKPFLSIELTKWKLRLFLGIPIFFMVIGYLLFIQTIFTPTTLDVQILFAFITLILILWVIAAPFYKAHLMRIAMAPNWMIRWFQPEAQLESVKLDKVRTNGKPYRKLQLVTYQGKCPICNNNVVIEYGKNHLKGRLIGICSESPREHIFSFDHVTKSGKKLT